MRLLRLSDYRRVPWRNGRGETLEIARAEAVTASGAPVWRLSRADVTEDGPFSAFPEYVRWLTVTRGTGLRLTGPEGFDATVRFGETVRFAGAPGPHGALLAGPVQDLNLMATPDRALAGAIPLTLAAPTRFGKPDGGDMLIHAATGAARLDGPLTATLAEGETLWLEAGDPAGEYRLARDGSADATLTVLIWC